MNQCAEGFKDSSGSMHTAVEFHTLKLDSQIGALLKEKPNLSENKFYQRHFQINSFQK